MPCIILLIASAEIRDKVAGWLKPKYEISVVGLADALPFSYDLVVADTAAFGQFSAELNRRRKSSAPQLLPLLLLATASELPGFAETLAADDQEPLFDALLEFPLDRNIFMVNVANLLRNRQLSRPKITPPKLESLPGRDSRYRLIAEILPQIVWTARADGNFDYFNQRWYDFTGKTFEETKDWGWQTLIHPEDLQSCSTLWSQSLFTGDLFEVEYRLRCRDGRYCWVLARALPFRDATGQVVDWFGTFTDIDNQKRTQESSDFLTICSSILVTSFDYKVILSRLVQLLVPTLADWCVVDLQDENDQIVRIAGAHRDPTKQYLVDELLYYPPDPSSENPSANVLRSSKTQCRVWDTTERLREIAEDEEHLKLLQQLQPYTSLVVPLTARGRAIGTISLIRTTPANNHYTDAEVNLAEEVAYRTALAVDNSRLYSNMQEVVRQNEETLALLNTLLDNAPVGMAFFDQNFRYVLVNKALAELNGVPVEAHIGHTISEVLPDVPAQNAILQQVLDTGQPVINLEDSGYVAKAELLHWLVSYYPITMHDDVTIGVGAVIADITERRRAEEAQSFLVEATTLLSSSLDYQTTLASLARLIVPILGDWCVIDVLEASGEFNRVAAAHADRAKEELVQRVKAYPPDPVVPSSVLNVVKSGKSEFMPYMTEDMRLSVAVNEDHLYIQTALAADSYIVVPLIARGRRLGAISFVMADSGRHYTPQDLILAEELAWRAALAIDNAWLYREAQNAIAAQRELDRLKDQFLSVASHELRTPLTSIKGFTQIFQRELRKREVAGDIPVSLVERQHRLLDNILHQSNRMGDLIDEMLDISRIQSGQLQLRYSDDVNVVQMVARIVEQQRDTTQDHSIVFDVQQPEIIVTVDEGRLEQVLNNLISNAIKYSPAETSVEVGLELQDSNKVLLWVSDSGFGISPEHQAHIFERFYRARNTAATNVDGLGLGLYISYEIIAQHGGRMWVESKLDEGSIFYILLPQRPDVTITGRSTLIPPAKVRT